MRKELKCNSHRSDDPWDKVGDFPRMEVGSVFHFDRYDMDFIFLGIQDQEPILYSDDGVEYKLNYNGHGISILNEDGRVNFMRRLNKNGFRVHKNKVINVE